ncbi:3-oxoacyl-[acyl-carrier-protein] reductase FabG [Novipirellula galeiformis]|uniref:3-oxoacyl-[acyl-carrier-protein] reductase FabG n=1 Tax=Novipirellula galeiformis TaxID=2528004 RepID=A0A5C6CTC0_9BACT|nr:SDR family oxidoreductase [Novipirellula galeiformis]TWU26787.1 3-oxoacyl-[acyl-carrier-protein] reductase FabG [Novipirellula galeiformis]
MTNKDGIPTTGRVILITGSSKGIGRYLAEQFASQGDHVIGCSRSVPTTPLPEEYRNRYEHHCLDVADETAVLALFHKLKQQHGRLDVLINNAGIASMNHCLLTPIDTVRSIFETNVIGTFLFCQEAAKWMLANRNGRIINLASVASPLKLEGESAYAASKAAVANLTQIMSHEFAPYGITVNAVGPSPIQTDLIRGVGAEKIKQLTNRQAIKRMATVEDVYNVIDFFVRPQSNFITGQVIYLGGI